MRDIVRAARYSLFCWLELKACIVDVSLCLFGHDEGHKDETLVRYDDSVAAYKWQWQWAVSVASGAVSILKGH